MRIAARVERENVVRVLKVDALPTFERAGLPRNARPLTHVSFARNPGPETRVTVMRRTDERQRPNVDGHLFGRSAREETRSMEAVGSTTPAEPIRSSAGRNRRERDAHDATVGFGEADPDCGDGPEAVVRPPWLQRCGAACLEHSDAVVGREMATVEVVHSARLPCDARPTLAHDWTDEVQITRVDKEILGDTAREAHTAPTQTVLATTAGRHSEKQRGTASRRR
jgi:hypothetical protein